MSLDFNMNLRNKNGVWNTQNRVVLKRNSRPNPNRRLVINMGESELK